MLILPTSGENRQRETTARATRNIYTEGNEDTLEGFWGRAGERLIGVGKKRRRHEVEVGEVGCRHSA